MLMGDNGTPERGEDDNDIILRNLGGSWDAKVSHLSQNENDGMNCIKNLSPSVLPTY